MDSWIVTGLVKTTSPTIWQSNYWVCQYAAFYVLYIIIAMDAYLAEVADVLKDM